ncbi:MAG: DUF3307 domain-containing protein [Muribaculaceae bacterium]
MAILLRLLFAHILADFFFQNDKICTGKEEKSAKGFIYLLLHSSIHSLTAYLCVAEWSNWIIPLVVFVSHTLIDYIKVAFMKKGLASFILDQLVHLAIIVILWLSLFDHSGGLYRDFFSMEWNSINTWVVFIAYILILKPTSVFLSLFVKRWTPLETADKSLPNAGKWIGYLERILILTFLLSGTTEGIGFLLAAKSIFRFGELSKAQEIKTTEYVLIGTLASFSIAILIGLSVLHIIK